MANYIGEKDLTAIADAVKSWRQSCLLSNTSVFVPGRPVWTSENFGALFQRFVDNPILGEESFANKLQTQLEPCAPDAKYLAAEIMWLLLLFPSNITHEKKVETIRRIWSWSGSNLPESHDMLGKPLAYGVGSGGMGYNTNRPVEYAYAIRVFRSLLELALDERRRVLDDAWTFAAWLDGQEGSGQRQFRHMLLFLMFPEWFERISSGTHKRKIVDVLKERVGDVSFSANDSVWIRTDKSLLAIRKQMERETGTTELDFYNSPLKALWDVGAEKPQTPPLDGRHGTYLLTWNPSKWHWDDLGSLAAQVAQGTPPKTWGTGERWSIAAHFDDIKIGDEVFLMRVRDAEKGIMAAGHVVNVPYEDAHWSGAAGKKAWYINISWTALLDPAKYKGLSIADLQSKVSPSVNWTPQRSGVRIPDELARALRDLWREHLARVGYKQPEPPPHVPDHSQRVHEHLIPYGLDQALADVFDETSLRAAYALLKTRLNVVLQGPPGVGKTYMAKALAYALLGAKDPSRLKWVQFHQSYSYEDFIEGYRPTSGKGFELREGVFVQFCKQAEADRSRTHVLVIDEINRGSLSRIFGEVLSLVEEDKREVLSSTLAYSNHVFSVPNNLLVLGLMNTADRSLAVVDYALRRRFRFVDLHPQFSSPKFASLLESRGVTSALRGKIQVVMSKLNFQIREDHRNLGEGFEIGHSFFCPRSQVDNEEQWFFDIVTYEISPLLREYWFDSPEKAGRMVKVFGEDSDT